MITDPFELEDEILRRADAGEAEIQRLFGEHLPRMGGGRPPWFGTRFKVKEDEPDPLGFRAFFKGAGVGSVGVSPYSFEFDRIDFKIRHDFGVALTDPRAHYKVPSSILGLTG